MPVLAASAAQPSGLKRIASASQLQHGGSRTPVAGRPVFDSLKVAPPSVLRRMPPAREAPRFSPTSTMRGSVGRNAMVVGYAAPGRATGDQVAPPSRVRWRLVVVPRRMVLASVGFTAIAVTCVKPQFTADIVTPESELLNTPVPVAA